MKVNNIKYFTTFLVIFVLLLGFSGCEKDEAEAETKDTTKTFVRLLENQTIFSRKLGRQMTYAVLLPSNYNTVKDSFAVVYLLHGFGDNQTAWYNGGGISYYSEAYKSDVIPMIYVMPQGFNTYWVNNYSGTYQLMDYVTKELVPEIDAKFRTKKDKSQRAVMGYSMGGYGALILPIKNPDVFSISVPLSMSFRTDQQYMAESQDGWNSQWGSIFGGRGMYGEGRLTAYYKEYSPFHFFNTSNVEQFKNLKLFIDCGDDEESLSETNDALHCLLRDKQIAHQYRVRNGAHTWDYWHGALHEALKFISTAVKGNTYPTNPADAQIGTLIPVQRYLKQTLVGTSIELGVLTPETYDTAKTKDFPVIYFIHDTKGGDRTENAIKTLSFFNNSMISSRIPKSIVVEIPANNGEITKEILEKIITQTDSNFRTIKSKTSRVIVGNGIGGNIAYLAMPDFKDYFNACYIFNASLSNDASIISAGTYYYLDVTDTYSSYNGYHSLYMSIRNNGNPYEYRVRQGDDSYQSFINGLNGAFSYIYKYLKY